MCAPQQVAPGNALQPFITFLPPATCVVISGQLTVQGLRIGAVPIATLAVSDGTAAVPITCALPGGCHRTLSLVSTTAASAADVTAHPGRILGRLRIALPRGV